MAPRIQETPSEEDEEELEELEDSDDEDQLESDAPDESSPQTSRAPTRAPARRPAARKSAQQTSSELSSVMADDDDAESQADELASDYEEPAPAAAPSSKSDKGRRLKIKLKVGESPVNPVLERTRGGGRRSSAASSTAGSIREGRGKKRAREEEDDETDPDDWSETGSETPDLSRMTARQRAKEIGETLDPMPYMQLPTTSKKGKYEGLTAQEIALKRSEDTRKRQSQLAKRLEDEKQETVNKLLKKQTGVKGKKGRRIKTPPTMEEEGGTPVMAPTATSETAVALAAAAAAAAAALPPTGFRHISSIRSGEFAYVFAIPAGAEDRFRPSQPPRYPGPRPAPPTRRLVAAV